MRNTSVISAARTVAERSAGSISDISPKKSGACSVASGRPVALAVANTRRARHDQVERVAERATDYDVLVGLEQLELARAPEAQELLLGHALQQRVLPQKLYVGSPHR